MDVEISFAICDESGFVGEITIMLLSGNWFKREIMVRIASFVLPVPVGRHAKVLPVNVVLCMFS